MNRKPSRHAIRKKDTSRAPAHRPTKGNRKNPKRAPARKTRGAANSAVSPRPKPADAQSVHKQIRQEPVKRGRPYGHGHRPPGPGDYRLQLQIQNGFVHVIPELYSAGAWTRYDEGQGIALTLHEFTRLAGQARKLLAQLKSKQLSLDLHKTKS